MPYVITTKRPGCENESVSRRAVATLEEARDIALEASYAQGDDGYDAVFPESGGTVGPLPDGTVIEVRPTTYVRLNREIGASESRLWDTQDCADIISAYNARES